MPYPTGTILDPDQTSPSFSIARTFASNSCMSVSSSRALQQQSFSQAVSGHTPGFYFHSDDRLGSRLRFSLFLLLVLCKPFLPLCNHSWVFLLLIAAKEILII